MLLANIRLTFLLLGILPAAGFGQISKPTADVQHYRYALTLNDANDTIQGQADITLRFMKDCSSFTLDLAGVDSAGKGMTVLSVREGARPIRFTRDGRRLSLYTKGRATSGHTYTIRYKGMPADGLIIARNKYGHRGFFGDNWPDRAHNWLPCIDHPSDKATLEFLITAPAHYTVVANGALVEEKRLPGTMKLTHWKESVPISPKVMVIGVADFAVDHPGDAYGVPVYNYLYPEDSAAGFRNYALALRILPFYISHIGPYPFEKCGNVQSKTRFGGLENASAIFYFENSVQSPGIESLMAHEIAHQWFGDAATETEWKYLWLSEGFATYMTHCYLEHQYGADSLARGMAEDRTRLQQYDKVKLRPIVDTTVKDNYMQLLNPNNYQKGSWVLHMLRRRLGDSLFWKGISTYYAAYRNRNASSSDLESVMEKVSGQDLGAFFHQWLDFAGQPRLLITWKKDDTASWISLQVEQQQDQLYEFPLEYSIDGVLYTMQVKDRSTTVRLQMKVQPGMPQVDPHCNLLATFVE